MRTMETDSEGLIRGHSGDSRVVLPMRQAFIGAGANLGDREITLEAALEELRANPAITYVGSSSTYETDPVGVTDQPRFLNLVAGVETTLTPEALLACLHEVEFKFGRVRTLRWGPRTLDLDLLAYEGEVRARPELILPHPRLLERAFVLVPLAEILDAHRFRRPAWEALRQQVRDARVDASGVRRVG